MLEAGLLSNFKDFPEYSLLTFGANYCILSPRDIALISSAINPLAPDFISGHFSLIPGILILFSVIERNILLGKSSISLDFSVRKPNGILRSEADRFQVILCLILHGGWIVVSEDEVIENNTFNSLILTVYFSIVTTKDFRKSSSGKKITEFSTSI